MTTPDMTSGTSRPSGTSRLQDPTHRGRWVEDIAFLAAVAMAVGYISLVEALPTVLYALKATDRQPIEHPFPWILVVFCLMCIAPKTISRAKVGDALVAIANRIGKRADS